MAELDGPVVRIVVTHFHPDHVGGAADVAALTGAPVFQGRHDYAQCVGAWEGGRGRLLAFMQSHGLPAGEAANIQADSERLRSRVRYVRDPNLLDPGTRSRAGRCCNCPVTPTGTSRCSATAC